MQFQMGQICQKYSRKFQILLCMGCWITGHYEIQINFQSVIQWYFFLQDWKDDMTWNSQCSVYKLSKHSHKSEIYLIDLDLNHAHKFNIAKFQTHTHHLPITKRHFKDESADMTCPLCPSQEVGDECHYLFHCLYFKEQRAKFIPLDMFTQPLSYCCFVQPFWKCKFDTACFTKIIMSYFKSPKSQKRSKNKTKCHIAHSLLPNLPSLALGKGKKCVLPAAL